MKCMMMVVVVLLAVVPAYATEAVQSLAGQWHFALDPAKEGQPKQWFAQRLPGETTIKLPGTMDDAGLGPKNTKTPTLEGPYRVYDYAGPAWYQREIDIPAGWDAQRVTLFLERCRWVTSVWLDERLAGTCDSLIAPHVYDFGTGVKPGKHRLTICVDNTVKLDMGRFVSALFGGTWGNMNGIIGRIELGTTPPVWIDDVQVYPDVAQMTARVAVKIGNATGKAGHGTLQVGDQSAAVTWDEKGGQAAMVVDRKGTKLWDEFTPNLTPLTVTLGDSSRTVQFGMRRFTAQGTQFAMNGRPVFLRGTLECSIWPLTGYPPTDVPAWQRIYRIIKAHGLNFIRFHSWCPPEAAFAAADLEGIMIQAEGPMANVSAGNHPARDAFIAAEYQRIVDTYGNHPSFCLMTLGNEFGGKADVLQGWVDMLIQRDARHLYSSASSAQKTPNRQWTELADGRGVHGTATMRDLRNVVASDARPIIGHEIGQWMYWPDPNEIKKWTGVMALKNFAMVRDDMAAKGLLAQVPQFVECSGKFATLLYKEEIEVLLRTPGYAGFSLLDLHDYPTQGTALIGPLDAFWDSKGFITPEAYQRFCGPTVPLARLAKRTYTTAEAFTAPVDVAHYGPVDLAHVTPEWSIKDEKGITVATGKLPATSIATGKLTSLGTISAALKDAPAPAKLIVAVRVGEFSNDWEIWVYPAGPAAAAPANVLVSRAWDQGTTAALAAGQSVVLLAAKTNAVHTLRGSFMPVFWSPVWFPSQQPNTNGIICDPRHPALAQFPTECYSNWQWWELLNHSRTLIMDEAPADFHPLVQVMDNFARNHKLANLFEARVGRGKLLACTIDLPGLAATEPAARQLLASLYAYAGSPQFQPGQALSAEFLETLFGHTAGSVMSQLGAKVSAADSAAPDYPAANVIDGDPETIWHTPWEANAPQFPHELVIEFPKMVRLKGCKFLPRQDMANGHIKGWGLYGSADSQQWSLISEGSFKRGNAWQTVLFPKPVETRYLKFVARSGFDEKQPYASLAELEVIAAAP